MRSKSQVVEDPGWRLSTQRQHPQDSLATRGNSKVAKTNWLYMTRSLWGPWPTITRWQEYFLKVCLTDVVAPHCNLQKLYWRIMKLSCSIFFSLWKKTSHIYGLYWVPFVAVPSRVQSGWHISQHELLSSGLFLRSFGGLFIHFLPQATVAVPSITDHRGMITQAPPKQGFPSFWHKIQCECLCVCMYMYFFISCIIRYEIGCMFLQ